MSKHRSLRTVTTTPVANGEQFHLAGPAVRRLAGAVAVFCTMAVAVGAYIAGTANAGPGPAAPARAPAPAPAAPVSSTTGRMPWMYSGIAASVDSAAAASSTTGRMPWMYSVRAARLPVSSHRGRMPWMYSVHVAPLSARQAPVSGS
jgi:hypothetical protein